MAKSRESSLARMISQMQKAFAREAERPRPAAAKPSGSGERQFLQLKITLKGISPPIWRRFVVPNDFTLDQLHGCLQIIMGWSNYHLYEFIVGGKRNGTYYSAPSSDDMEDIFGGFDDYGSENADDYDLNFLSKKGMKFLYIYDMGDSWEHEIVVENANYEYSGDLPVFVLDGKRNCPPEDCGGSWGYANLLEALADRKHPEHRDMKEWIGKFDPEEFDLNDCNAALASRFGTLRKKTAKKTAKKTTKKSSKKQ